MRLEQFLEESAEVKTFAAGEVIAVEGQTAEAAYVVKSGKVSVYSEHDGHESVLGSLGPDEIFGEMALLRYDVYTLNVRADEDTACYVITPDLLHGQIRETPPLVKAILDALVDRIHDVNDVLIDIDVAASASQDG